MRGIEGDPARSAATTGGRLFVLGYASGLLIAAAILYMLSGTTPNVLFQFIREWPLQTTICITVGPITAFGFGRWAAIEVALGRRDPWVVVPLLSFASVWSTVLSLGLSSFFQDGVGNEPILTRIQAYTLKPLFLVSVYGFPFIIVVSLLIAYRFQRSFRSDGRDDPRS